MLGVWLEQQTERKRAGLEAGGLGQGPPEPPAPWLLWRTSRSHQQSCRSAHSC